MKNRWIPPQRPWAFLYIEVNSKWWIFTKMYYKVKIRTSQMWSYYIPLEINFALNNFHNKTIPWKFSYSKYNKKLRGSLRLSKSRIRMFWLLIKIECFKFESSHWIEILRYYIAMFVTAFHTSTENMSSIHILSLKWDKLF